MADDLPILSTPAASVPARPLLGRWLFEQQLNMAEAARVIGVSREMVRLYCLPFDDRRRCPPSKAARARIAAFTEAAVPEWTFDDTPAARAAFFTPPVIARAVPAGAQP